MKQMLRMPELQGQMAARPNDPVFITEGEKDADKRSHAPT